MSDNIQETVVHRQTPEGDVCPSCGMDSLERDAVDIGIGTQYSPWRCHDCGWTELCTYHNVPLPCADCREIDFEELSL